MTGSRPAPLATRDGALVFGSDWTETTAQPRSGKWGQGPLIEQCLCNQVLRSTTQRKTQMAIYTRDVYDYLLLNITFYSSYIED